jgi:LmbE family N-acetylglucosaminyl deacetylase
MKILAVFAHPDDEAFGPGGTLVRYSLSGHSVRLVTMTRGEAGTLGPARNITRLELGRLRAEELRCSAAALRVSALINHNLPDGGLAGLPEMEGLSIIRHEIDAFRPDAVITFHSAGISGHADHRTVAHWCLQAVKERTESPRLFAFGVSEEQAQRVGHRRLAPIPDDEITHVIDVSPYLDYKLNAIRCHQSQSESWESFNKIAGGIDSFFRFEYFSRIWPEPMSHIRSDRLEE